MPSRQPKIDIRREPTLRKGPAKRSKQVMDRIKATESLRGSIETFKDAAATGFRERFEGELRDGEVMPDQSVALELALRSVITALEELVEADKIYCRATMARSRLDKACREVAEREVYPRVRDLRHNLEWLFGKELGRELHGLKGPTLRKPKRVLPQVEDLVDRLRRQSGELPPPRMVGVVVDRGAWVGQVEPGYKKLKKMMRELEQRKIDEQHQRQVKDIALEDFDEVYGEALAFVRSVYRLAGYDDRVVWHLLPNTDRRRLKREARGEREARAEGRRAGRRDREEGGPIRVA